MAYRSRYGRSYNYGYEAAKRHIVEAKKLSEELGGTDEDVKAYFFSLSREELRRVLDEYEKKFGSEKRAYAAYAFPLWKSGKREMSGVVAGRLYSLLPARMPVVKKLDMVESLWKHCGKSSTKNFYIGKDADPLELTQKVRNHFEDKVQPHSINETITNRFSWLAQEDSQLYQQLKNHFLQLERDQLTNASFDRIAVLLKNFKANTNVSQSIQQEFQVGKHSVILNFNEHVEGISETQPSIKDPMDYGCLIIFVIGIIIFLAAAFSD